MCDVVEVLNGDRVTGTLNNLTSGRLTFDTPYAGKIYIDWKQVRGIETTSKYEVDLMNGQTITGAIATVQPGEYRIGPERGATILASDITAIRTPPDVHGGLLSDWHATTDWDTRPLAETAIQPSWHCSFSHNVEACAIRSNSTFRH